MRDTVEASFGALRVGIMVHAFPVISETFVTNLAVALADAGHDVRILATDPRATKGPVHDLVARAELTQKVARAAPDGRLTFARALALAREAPARAPMLAGLALLDRLAPARLAVTHLLAGEAPFDVIHAQFGWVGLTAARHRGWGTLRTRALVVHLRGHDITSFVAERGPGIYSRLFREADLFIANCAHFRDRAVALGCPPDKITVIGSPIDTDVFVPPLMRPKPGGRPLALVGVGRLVEKKGFADAIGAVARLVRAGKDVQLDLLGDGPLRGALEAQAAGAGLNGRVVFRGAARQDEVIAALHRADIALAPSVRAGTGDEDAPVNTLKEAMATELPVIATRHGGIPELVEDGVNGILVPERDPVALAAAIGRLGADPAAWRRLGAAGRKKTVENYDRRSILRKTLQAYRRALGEDGDET